MHEEIFAAKIINAVTVFIPGIRYLQRRVRGWKPMPQFEMHPAGVIPFFILIPIVMIKVLRFLIRAIYWLWLFIVPAGTSAVASFFLYEKPGINIIWPVIVFSAGLICGVCLAEFIRRKYGLENFFTSEAFRKEN